MFKAGSQHRQKETPPSPTYMKDDQFAAYLANLRSSRQNRPAGARELPADPRRSRNRMSMGSSASGPATDSSSSASASSGTTIPDQVSYTQSRQTVATDASTLNGSVRSRYSTSSQAKDYYPTKPVLPLKPSEVVPSTTYIERGSRWMEKEEAHSLRQAMEVLDMRDAQKMSSSPPSQSTAAMGHGSIAASIPPQNEEEERIYNAALDEASELVWQHQNGVVPNPNAPYAYRPHMRKNSYAHARTAAAGIYGDDIVPSGLARDRAQSISEGSSDGDAPGSRPGRFSIDSARQSGSIRGTEEASTSSPTDAPATAMTTAARANSSAGASSSSYSGMNSGKYAPSPRRRSSMKRNISGEIDRPFSGEQIWEEPESRHNSPAQHVSSTSPPATAPPASTTSAVAAAAAAVPASAAPALATASSSAGPRSSTSTINSRPLPKPIKPYERSENEPLSRVEIHRNPPTQSRNPMYMRSDSTASASRSAKNAAEASEVPRKNGVEIRSDDVRNATRICLSKDRKIPTPTAVSDNPGRPIVSFDANWTPPDESTDKRLGNGRSSPPSSSSFSALPDASGAQAGSLGGSGPGSRSSSPTKGSSAAEGFSKAGFSSPSPFSSRGRGGVVGRFSSPSPAQSPAEATPPSSFKGAPMAPPSIAVSRDTSPAKTQPNVNVNVPSISVQVPSISVGCDDNDDHDKRSPSKRGMPPIPTISVPDVPSINVSGDDSSSPAVPSIVVPGDDSSATSASKTPAGSAARPLPTPSGPGGTRPLPHHPRHHWSPAPGSVRRGMTVCHECGLPIEGRFVALAGSREKFHPSCFACYTCGTNLEALEISPEPETARAERLERIRLRNSGQAVPDEPGKTAIDDGDDRLRFYCHLDWHEQFAPRCKHCKTPILGEHIVALGNHWHYGHFFCAECGDPFEHGMTHIEKDGYAWCVRCQTRRTERRAPKCKKCKAAVIGQYVQALGGEWHENCFRCATCDGGFDDGQIFPVERGGGTAVLCTQCRMRELKR